MPDFKYGRASLSKTATEAGDFFLGSNFGFEIESLPQNGITNVDGVKFEYAVTPYKDGEANEMRSRPGVGLQITVKVKREYSGDKTFSIWRNNVMKGTTDRRSITIKFLTDNHTSKGQLDMFHAWPSAYYPPGFNARSSANAFESLDLVCEEWKFS
jgi:phage tail-like protein